MSYRKPTVTKATLKASGRLRSLSPLQAVHRLKKSDVPDRGWSQPEFTTRNGGELVRDLATAQRVSVSRGIARLTPKLTRWYAQITQQIVGRFLMRVQRYVGLFLSVSEFDIKAIEDIILAPGAHEIMWQGAIEEVLREQGMEFNAIMSGAIQSVADTSHSTTIDLLGVVETPGSRSSLQGRIRARATRVVGITDTLRARLDKILRQGIHVDMLTVAEMAKLIRERLPELGRSRISTIARTEMGQAADEGRKQGIKDSGVVMEISVVGCEDREANSPQYRGESTCNIQDVPIGDIDKLEFHINHTGTIVPSRFVEEGPRPIVSGIPIPPSPVAPDVTLPLVKPTVTIPKPKPIPKPTEVPSIVQTGVPDKPGEPIPTPLRVTPTELIPVPPTPASIEARNPLPNDLDGWTRFEPSFTEEQLNERFNESNLSVTSDFGETTDVMVEAFDEEFGGMPDDVMDSYFPTPEGFVRTRAVIEHEDAGVWRFSASFSDREKTGGFRIDRVFKLNQNIVEHESFSIAKNLRGRGISKQMLRAHNAVYKKMGIGRIDLAANISVGGYAWFRFGFLPRGSSALDMWTRVKRKAEDLIADSLLAEPSFGLTPNLVEYLSNLIDLDPTPTTAALRLRELAGLKEKVNDPNLAQFTGISGTKITVGQHLLLGTDWLGDLDYTDEASVAIFEAYIGE